MTTEFDVRVGDGLLHGYDNQSEGDLVVVWHHGTPNIGLPPRPLFERSQELGIRWISYDRPGYGGSSSRPNRTIGSAADDVAAIADHLGIERYAVMGHSGGGSHALASGALHPERTIAAVSAAGLAPFGADGLDWFAGMIASGVASLRAAASGRKVKERFEASGTEYDPEFTTADMEILGGDWSWLNQVVGPAMNNGPAPLIDDDLAYVSPWGFDPKDIGVPVLLLHGDQDGIVPSAHSKWLAQHCRDAEVRLFPEDGHLSVLRHATGALDWLREKAG